MTDLQNYLKNQNLTTTQFANAVGVTHSAVVKWLQGKCYPRREAMLRILTVTNGQVTPADFYDAPSAPAATSLGEAVGGVDPPAAPPA